MDKLMVEYCNENNYKIVDVSSKLNKHCRETADFLFDLFKVKSKDSKYNKVLFFISSKKIHPLTKKLLFSVFDKQNCRKELMFYFNKERMQLINEDVSFTKIQIEEFFKQTEKICCICLEEIDGKMVGCPTCTAIYHAPCIENPSYKFFDATSKYCCMCKKSLADRVS
jgi:hypothetical protein